MPMVRVVVVLGLATLAACYQRPDLGPIVASCDLLCSGGTCPDGLTCNPTGVWGSRRGAGSGTAARAPTIPVRW